MEEIPYEASKEAFRKTTRDILMQSVEQSTSKKLISELDPEKYEPPADNAVVRRYGRRWTDFSPKLTMH